LTKPFDLYDAVQFLRADLVWSADFESVRLGLADLFQAVGENLSADEIKKLEPALSKVVTALNESTEWDC
jgi:hypothetical protein